MPTINVREADFEAVAGAAMDAKAAGNIEQARELDRIARKINLALSNQTVRDFSPMNMGENRGKTWRDMPSTIGER